MDRHCAFAATVVLACNNHVGDMRAVIGVVPGRNRSGLPTCPAAPSTMRRAVNDAASVIRCNGQSGRMDDLRCQRLYGAPCSRGG